MAISKKIREQVYSKYNGLCAYTGKPLDEKWQVDHVTPKDSWKWLIVGNTDRPNDIDNLKPAMRIVNHYKRALDLEGFRRYLMTLHVRLRKLPKKTKLQSTERRKEYLYEVANHFGVSVEKPFDGKFYFEKS